MNLSASLPKRPRGRPARSGEEYADTRTILVRGGVDLLTRQGVMATTLDDLLKLVKVPKGSFYHCFVSKDALVTAALDAYASYFARKLDHHFGDSSVLPLARLDAFVEDACHGVERHHFSRGCLVGNLGQEVNCLSDELRQRLEAILCDWEQRLAACLQSAVTEGQLAADANCPALAHAFWIGWEGAILRARLMRSTSPMRDFLKFFQTGLPRP